MLSEKVARLRQLMSEAVPRKSESTAEAAATRRFQLYEFNTGPTLVVDQSPRARQERDIQRIASWYGWGGEVVRALDGAGACTVQGLDDAQLLALHERMRQLEQCAQEGLDPPDMPPAR